MRIAYGVHGYGRGHATRALSVLPELAGRHELLILAGGEAYSAIWPDFPVFRIPTLGYYYDRHGRRSNYQTFKRNLPAVLDLLLRGPAFQMVLDTVRDFRPDVVISDAEPYTHRVARLLRIPRIGFDHFGIMAHCKPPLPIRDMPSARRDVLVYRALMGDPQRVIVSSFYPAPPRRRSVRVVGPLLREAVRNSQPRAGRHLLAYFNNGLHQFTPRLERTLRQLDCRVLVYGVQRQGSDGCLDFRPASNLPFIEDMAGCRAVISTAGNQLVGETMHLGKPILVMPEDCVEQRLNAAAVERMGIGRRVDFLRLTPDFIRRFLKDEQRFVESIARQRRDGRREAIDAIEQCLRELSASPTSAAPSPARRPVAS
ncbi:MAG: glycosyltransferase family protein [Phycisphaerae bacterium]